MVIRITSTAWPVWLSTVPANGDGTSTVLQGRYSDVKAQRDGQWVYIMDHASVPLPPAPAAAPADSAAPAK